MRIIKLIGLLYCLNFFSGCNGVFYQPSDQIFYSPSNQEIEYETLTFETEDNLKLTGWLLKTSKKVKGTVLQFHGNAENMTSHFLYASWLVDQGYQVVTFDYRGYGQSPGNPSRGGMVIDGKTAIQAACNHDLIRKKGLVLLAQSLGGAIAVPSYTAANSAKCIKGVVLDSTFASYRGIARNKLGNIWLTWPFQWPMSFLISNDLSPIDSINNIKSPLLFIHSRQDHVVPFEEGEKLVQSFTGKKKEFWILDSPGHTYAFAPPKSPYRKKLTQWLAKAFRN